jgi:glucan phosphoethanolaminetransferase (alkaline phosphatase superfamily)
MTQDEIIDMARQAGFGMPWLSHEEHQAVFAFAKLVAEKEREACAELCKNFTPTDEYGSSSVADIILSRGEA